VREHEKGHILVNFVQDSTVLSGFMMKQNVSTIILFLSGLQEEARFMITFVVVGYLTA
jgi:hypothetical protein